MEKKKYRKIVHTKESMGFPMFIYIKIEITILDIWDRNNIGTLTIGTHNPNNSDFTIWKSWFFENIILYRIQT